MGGDSGNWLIKGIDAITCRLIAVAAVDGTKDSAPAASSLLMSKMV